MDAMEHANEPADEWHIQRSGQQAPWLQAGKEGQRALPPRCPSGTLEHMDQQQTTVLRPTCPDQLRPAPAQATALEQTWQRCCTLSSSTQELPTTWWGWGHSRAATTQECSGGGARVRQPRAVCAQRCPACAPLQHWYHDAA